jgi:hypothetical protein
MRDLLQSMDDTVPGTFEITKEGLVHDLQSPNGPHELTRARLRRRLEKGPRYATRKDFVYGEDVTIADWTIPTDGLPVYEAE